MQPSRAWLGRNVLVALVVTGCSLVLQPEELSTRTVIDAGSEASVNPIACSRDADCDSPKSFSPEGCAVSSCVDQVCAFFAPDKDGDGAPMACRSLVPSRVVNGSAEGVDCDDTNPRVFPGTFVECGESETGETLLSSQADAGAGPMFAKPKGACTIGKRSCGKDGKISACIGTVGPKAEVCGAVDRDENCDGSVNEGCTCSPDSATESCGSTSVGECKKGIRTCTGGKWSSCSGNVEPAAKICTSLADNDCNGLADNTEYNLQTDANNCGGGGKGGSNG